MYMTRSDGVSCGCESDVWESSERDRNGCEFYVREMNGYKTCVRVRRVASAGVATGALASPICVTRRS